MYEGPFGPTSPEAQADPDEERAGPPWEHAREAGGYVLAYFRTAGEVLFRPQTTFRAMSLSPRLNLPLLYWFLPTLISTIVSTVLFTAIGRMFRAVLSSVSGIPMASEVAATATTPGLLCMAAGLMPMFFVMAAYYHLLLRLFGGARRGFVGTFRALAYVNGSLATISWAPCIGPVIALVWGAYLEIIGLREVHDTTTARAAAAVVLGILGPLTLFVAMLVYALVTGGLPGLADHAPIPMV
ncbi:hypothetical protein HN371_17020 [Candidatus Poribacteria bacterium]|jgi:hypothetical protein|nr:hypothetical protein [Candidatus Poribacteria bacterium]MBT5533988.1 hypothetical protein [Candidatus Poribacteria bacterium]MBT5713907.1 hypothetical protein [Candidatus Poribacteria bacterium]MBT7097283.1 hypothetical protein [Candidatus Poribacteria bacterium]MBT7808723.1 hypothetical protein [Candidatus Poribacteria bacterium]